MCNGSLLTTTGLEFRDATLLLNAKNLALFKNDMFFNLTLGFQNVPLTDKVGRGFLFPPWPRCVIRYLTINRLSALFQDRRSCKKDAAVKNLETFSLLISDTIRVGSGSVDDKVLTRFDHSLSKIQWEISEEGAGEDEEDDDEEEAPKRTGGRVAPENILEVRLRSRAKENEDGLNQGDLDRRASELMAKKTKDKAKKWGDRALKEEEDQDEKVEDIKTYQ